MLGKRRYPESRQRPFNQFLSADCRSGPHSLAVSGGLLLGSTAMINPPKGYSRPVGPRLTKMATTAMAWYAIFNGIGRIAWGSISDHIGRKAAIILMAPLQGVIMLVIYHYLQLYLCLAQKIGTSTLNFFLFTFFKISKADSRILWARAIS